MERSAKRQRVSLAGGQSKPILALFPSTRPPASAQYNAYSPLKSSNQTILVAETADLEFESRPNGADDDEQDDEDEASYMLGVFDKSAGQLTLHSAQLHSLKPTVKALKSLSATTLDHSNAQERRAALGTAFGTKKAQRAQNAQERSKMTETSLGTASNVQSILQSTIAGSSASLPSADAVREQANLARQIPPPNMAAQSADQAYNLSDVVSDPELAAILLHELIAVQGGQRARNDLLPHRHSEFIKSRMARTLRKNPESIDDVSSADQTKLKLLCHLAFLFTFRKIATGGARNEVSKSFLAEKLGNPPAVILDGILNRYTEPASSSAQKQQSDDSKRKLTSTNEIKLLTYMAYIVLYIDNFSTDATLFANDLGTSPNKIREVFRSLGCQVVALSTAEAERAVASKQYATVPEAKKSRKAILRVPLEFPKERRGIPKR